MEHYITIEEAAAILNVHQNTVRNLDKRGEFPNTFKKGHVVLYYGPDVEAYKLQKEVS